MKIAIISVFALLTTGQALAQEAEKSNEQVRAEFAAIVEKQRNERQFDVLLRLQEGCEAMFKRDPDATITNQLCFDLFMDRGLPD